MSRGVGRRGTNAPSSNDEIYEEVFGEPRPRRETLTLPFGSDLAWLSLRTTKAFKARLNATAVHVETKTRTSWQQAGAMSRYALRVLREAVERDAPKAPKAPKAAAAGKRGGK